LNFCKTELPAIKRVQSLADAKRVQYAAFQYENLYYQKESMVPQWRRLLSFIGDEESSRSLNPFRHRFLLLPWTAPTISRWRPRRARWSLGRLRNDVDDLLRELPMSMTGLHEHELLRHSSLGLEFSSYLQADVVHALSPSSARRSLRPAERLQPTDHPCAREMSRRDDLALPRALLLG